MALTLAVVKETKSNETRVSIVPETVKKLAAEGVSVIVEKGAGDKASYLDDAYKAAGAKIVASALEAVKSADIVASVNAPEDATLKACKKSAVIVGNLDPFNFKSHAAAYADQKLNAVAMEWVPRITRAQSMDVLSSQSNLAGYASVIEAAQAFGKAFPMMMTAAGTISPAKVFVMGAGVAGLQAIATAKRLGAVVSATDVRAAAKEQVQSLGGSFVMVENDETREAETSGGYAKEMSEDYKKQQAALIAETIAKQDIVITTALIPGRPAPLLVDEDMVKSMKPGSVIVDMAAVQGGNCALTQSGKTVVKHGVTIIGHDNFPGLLPVDASALYSRNVLNFLKLVIAEGKINLNLEDEVVAGVLLTENGVVIHERLKDAAPKSKPAAKKAASASTAKKAPAKKTTAKKATTKTTQSATAKAKKA